MIRAPMGGSVQTAHATTTSQHATRGRRGRIGLATGSTHVRGHDSLFNRGIAAGGTGDGVDRSPVFVITAVIEPFIEMMVIGTAKTIVNH